MSFRDKFRRQPSMEEALLAGGVPEDDIERAAAVGGLELLAIDRLLEEAPRTLSQRDIAELAGLPVEDVSQVWRALGFPHVEPDEKVYTQADADMTAMVGVAARPGPDRRRPDPADGPGHRPVAVPGGGGADRGDGRPPVAERQRGGRHPVRRALRPARGGHARRPRVRVAPPPGGRGPAAAGPAGGGRPRAGQRHAWSWASPTWWGSRRCPSSSPRTSWPTSSAASRPWPPTWSRCTAAASSRRSATRSCSRPTTRSPAPQIALGLSEQFRAEEVVSDVRVGMAYGPVLQYEGDLYGPTVNLAHRIVGIAYPGSVVVPGAHRAGRWPTTTASTW